MWLLKEFFVATFVIITLEETAGSGIRNSPFWYHFEPTLNHRMRWNEYDTNKQTPQHFRTPYEAFLEAMVSNSDDGFDQPKIKSYIQQQLGMTGDTFSKRRNLSPEIYHNTYISGEKATPPPKSDYDDEPVEKRQQQLKTGDTFANFRRRNTHITPQPEIYNPTYKPGTQVSPPRKTDDEPVDKREEQQPSRVTEDPFVKRRNTQTTPQPEVHETTYKPGTKATPPPKSDYDDEPVDKRQEQHWEGVYDVARSASPESFLITVYY